MNISGRINITNICNLNCSYCYNKNDFKISTYENCINFINKLQLLPYFDNNIEFTGGEPSLVRILLHKIIDKFPNINFSIITNGYFIFSFEEDLELYNKFKNITITLEGTQKSYLRYKNNDNLQILINKIITLKKEFPKIQLNVKFSLNSLLFEDIIELSNNYNLLTNNNINVIFYRLYDNDGITIENLYNFCNKIKSINKKMLYSILYPIKIELENYLCSYNNKITLNTDNALICCQYNKNIYGDATKLEDYFNIYKEIEKNNINIYEVCKNCIVPIKFCHISCPYYINNMIKNNQIEKLNNKCNTEKILQYFRKEVI